MTKPIHFARCHCGTVELKLTLPEGLKDPRRCTCSMCRKRGAIAISVDLEHLEIVQGADNLSLYQFNTMTAKHYFCKTCGIYTHHQRRSNPHQFGVNAACVDGVQPFELEPVRYVDGVNHPKDKP
ncbi:GFA family protein [Vibrio ulleungensis]|uniref:GFA family protein n=1 Tax=Vibrio ulleungensis TaxID=2807619 RepID=A0ABS2HGE5_9VIBR|nr:GFA family protein [Vibrio ulleungensis]MBM7035527.1 GFA family protein [Vibrio ulleungensis]